MGHDNISAFSLLLSVVFCLFAIVLGLLRP